MAKVAKVQERKIVKLKDLKQHPKNAKKHPPWQIEKLAQAIDLEGYNQEIVIDEFNVVLKGWGRVLALIEKGFEEAEVVVEKGLTEDEKIAMIIRDNKVVSQEWDNKILMEELPRLSGLGLETGFSEKEIKDLPLKIKTEIEDFAQAVYDMSPRLYEKYNYILLFFKNDIDFLWASQKLGVKKMADRMKPQKIGMYRAVDGITALKNFKK